MKKSISISLLVLASACANAANLDLSAFQYTSGSGGVAGNLVTLTSLAGSLDSPPIASSGMIVLTNVDSFEYLTSGALATFAAQIPGVGMLDLASYETSTRHTFNTPYSGLVQFTANPPGGGSSTLYLRNFNVVAAVPEPETYAMFLAGLAMTGLIARRQKKKVRFRLGSPARRCLADA